MLPKSDSAHQMGIYETEVSLNGKITKTDHKLDTTKCEPKRDQWKSRFDFLVACLGFSIGLGNVWRFPYLCYKNGGGAFLLPYFISVFLAGIPLFLLEIALGQFMCRAVIAAWNICPLFRGIGIGSTLINFLLSCYYTVILSWAFHFLFSSFTGELPWTKCGQAWNTNSCTIASVINNNSNSTMNRTISASDPTLEYWERRVLRISDGIDNIGTVQWDLALCLLLTWIIIFLCICKGIKTSGKIMYVTSSTPYIFMLILLIRTMLLNGSYSGLTYYLTPDWTKLADMTVWSDAGTQVFFSYSIGLGALTALGSYNRFNHKSYWDCLLFAATNSFTSLLAGCVVFGTLGYMSYTSGLPINEVAESGPGLAFIIYPKAIGTMPGSPIWSICFFCMLILLGIDGMFGGVEGFVAAIADYIPQLSTNPKLRYLFVGSVCLISYCIGLPMVSNGGMYIFQIFDYYSGSRIILVIGFMESVVLGYVYGAKRFNENFKEMYGFSFGWLTYIVWCVLTPIFTLVLFICSVIVYEELTYQRASLEKPYRFPDWAVDLGWCMASSSVLLIPLVMIVELVRARGSLLQRIKYLCTPRYTERRRLLHFPPEVAHNGILINMADQT